MDLIKYDMTDIWAVAGDVVAPDSAKIRSGWGVEVVPRQWWNWFENRQDQNIAYMLQKGIPEWDAATEYIINKSYVQRNGIVYRATATSTNSDPVLLTSWVKAFVDSSAYLETLKTLAVVPNTQPYIDGAGVAQNADSSAFGRQIGNVADAAAARTLISAQLAHANLTGLSGVSGSANNLPYFIGSGAMAVTTFTGFARTLLDDADAVAMRATLGVDSAADTSAALAAGLATKQPLDATLTALAGLATGVNQLPYSTGTDTFSQTTFTAAARTLLAAADAAAERVVLDVPSNSEVTSAITASANTRQPLDATLTALAGLATGANQLAYSTGTDTFSQTTLTPFARTILDDTDAASVRATISAQAADATLTALAGLATGADQLPYSTGSDTFSQTTLTAYARTLLDDADAVTARLTLGLGTMATQASSSVSITGGSITGITDITVADGGTGASTAAGARANLGTNDASNLTTGTVAVALGGTGATTTTGTGSNVLSTSPTFTGAPLSPTASTGANNTQIATTAFVQGELANAGIIAKAACTAWVNFNGTGTVAIRDSYNVTSITDNAIGDYTVNFTTPMLNANYQVAASVGPTNGSTPNGVVVGAGPGLGTDVPPTANGFRILAVHSGTVLVDIARIGLNVFGGRA